jgi:hypothetical protein
MARGTNFREMVAFFERHELHFQTHPNEPLVHMQMTGKNGSWSFMAHCDDEADRFAAYSRAPIQVPAPKRAAVAEYLTRANWGLKIGNFEMDYSDGEVRYKTAMDTDGTCLNDELLGSMVFVNCAMMDRYLPGLMAVVFGDAIPEEAVKQAEADLDHTSADAIEAVVRRLFDGTDVTNPPANVPHTDDVPTSPVARIRRWLHRGRA